MKQILSYLNSFTLIEKLLWTISVFFIVLSFFLFDRENFLTLFASIIGVTSLIFNAKGNPAGQLLMVLFSLLYGIISYSQAYYGEMITYLGMTMPMAGAAFFSWLKNPYEKGKAEVKINKLHWTEFLFLSLLTLAVTILFYFILKAFHTNNLYPSTLSVTTSFVAVYLTFRRSPYYAVGYAANDIVLIFLWFLVSMQDARYLSVTVCFLAFFANDLYGFFSWRKMQRRQHAGHHD